MSHLGLLHSTPMRIPPLFKLTAPHGSRNKCLVCWRIESKRIPQEKMVNTKTTNLLSLIIFWFRIKWTYQIKRNIRTRNQRKSMQYKTESTKSKKSKTWSGPLIYWRSALVDHDFHDSSLNFQIDWRILDWNIQLCFNCCVYGFSTDYGLPKEQNVNYQGSHLMEYIYIFYKIRYM